MSDRPLWASAQEEAQENKEAALAQVAMSNEEWIQDVALPAIQEAAHTLGSFTTDNVWARVEVEPREMRAMGAAMLRAQRKGWIRPGAAYVPSRRPVCNRRPVRIWESLIQRRRKGGDAA